MCVCVKEKVVTMSPHFKQLCRQRPRKPSSIPTASRNIGHSHFQDSLPSTLLRPAMVMMLVRRLPIPLLPVPALLLLMLPILVRILQLAARKRTRNSAQERVSRFATTVVARGTAGKSAHESAVAFLGVVWVTWGGVGVVSTGLGVLVGGLRVTPGITAGLLGVLLLTAGLVVGVVGSWTGLLAVLESALGWGTVVAVAAAGLLLLVVVGRTAAVGGFRWWGVATLLVAVALVTVGGAATVRGALGWVAGAVVVVVGAGHCEGDYGC